MRASTLFILVIAVLFGVGTVFAVNYYGLLNGKNGTGAKKDELPFVLVAQHNLFQGLTASSAQVKVRQLTQLEYNSDWKVKESKAMPPMVESVHSRILKKNVPAGTVLLQEHFEDLRLPQSMSERLLADHVVVYVHLPKNQAGGGTIQIDERVDVILTTTVCYTPDCRVREEMTAPIALNLRVVGKRDNLFSFAAPVDNMVSLHLEANHYRAAVIEYSKRNGVLTLVPSSHRMQTMPMMDSKEEANNAILVKTGAMRIGRDTLMKLFNVKERVQQAREPASPPKPPHILQIMGGVHHRGYLLFPDKTPVAPQPVGFGETGPPPSGSQSFSYPAMPNIPMSSANYYSPVGSAPMSDPMEAFSTISFRQPDGCTDLPNSSKKG